MNGATHQLIRLMESAWIPDANNSQWHPSGIEEQLRSRKKYSQRMKIKLVSNESPV